MVTLTVSLKRAEINVMALCWTVCSENTQVVTRAITKMNLPPK